MTHDLQLNAIDIDVGGTFTDCVVSLGGQRTAAKALTSHHNLSEGFLTALGEALEQLGLSAEELMEKVGVVRYSTTLAINKLLARQGPRLGLVTTRGFEDAILIGKGAQWADGLLQSETRNLSQVDKPAPLIPRGRIVGVRERITYSGRILQPLDEDDVRDKLSVLVDKGVRGIVVSLLWSHQRPDHELRVREIIEEVYPELSIGSMPTVLSHEVQPKKGEYRRTLTAILNTYLHRPMAEDLQGLRRKLRDMGYRKEILIVRNSGSLGDVMKTTAIETYNGGPAAGVAGGVELARLYGFRNVVTTDMGGTSFDIGMICNGAPQVSDLRPPVIDRWMVHTTSVETTSIGGGGGTIAWVDDSLLQRLRCGPRSAGSLPGPACYNQGGLEPTVTDADVVLGYINPDRFHGGKIRIDRERARASIRDRIARPLGLTAEEAAARIRALVNGSTGNAIYRETVLRGRDPKEFALFSFGGAGPTHCCDYSRICSIDRIVCFSFSPVFSAFMSSLLPIRQIYEVSRRLPAQGAETGWASLDLDAFNATTRRLIKTARQGAVAEGLEPEKLSFHLEVDMKYEDQLHLRRIPCAQPLFTEERHTRELLHAFARQYSEAFSSAGMYPEGGITIENFVLHSVYPCEALRFPRFEGQASSPSSSAKSGKRMVFWANIGNFSHTQTYDLSQLVCGNTIDGPAVIEADHTTIVLPHGYRLVIDAYMNCSIELVT